MKATANNVSCLVFVIVFALSPVASGFNYDRPFGWRSWTSFVPLRESRWNWGGMFNRHHSGVGALWYSEEPPVRTSWTTPAVLPKMAMTERDKKKEKEEHDSKKWLKKEHDNEKWLKEEHDNERGPKKKHQSAKGVKKERDNEEEAEMPVEEAVVEKRDTKTPEPDADADTDAEVDATWDGMEKERNAKNDKRPDAKIAYPDDVMAACLLDAGSCWWDSYFKFCRTKHRAFRSGALRIWGPPRSAENDCSVLAARLSRGDLHAMRRALEPCPRNDRLCKFETLSTKPNDCIQSEFQVTVDNEVCTEKKSEPPGFGIKPGQVCCLRRYVKPNRR